MAPFSKLILALALTGAAAKDFTAQVQTAEEGKPVTFTWNQETDKVTAAQTFVNTHAGEIEGLGCTKGDTECFTNVLMTHMLKTEEGADLPALNLGAPMDTQMERGNPFEAGKKIREAPDFKEHEVVHEVTEEAPAAIVDENPAAANIVSEEFKEEIKEEVKEEAEKMDATDLEAFEAGKKIREAEGFKELELVDAPAAEADAAPVAEKN